jgi:DNA-directed RNA polymerase sigma subunit (sigma70/sigma32)
LSAFDPVDSLVVQETKEAVHRVLWGLKSQHQKVIARRFGIGFDHEYTLEEIGQEFGLTRQRIQQIEVKALEKLGKFRGELRAHYEASEWRLCGGPSLGTRQRPLALRSHVNAA